MYYVDSLLLDGRVATDPEVEGDDGFVAAPLHL